MSKSKTVITRAAMVQIWTISVMTFSDITKQNGRASVGTLYREVVFPYDSIYKFEKGQR